MIKQNKIDYVELAANDMPATRTFFTEVFGWKFKMWGDAYMDTHDGGLTIGFYQSDLASISERGGALVTIYSENLELTLDSVIEHGAKISKDIFDFPGGRRFQFFEPSGNEFAVWTDK